LCARGLSYHRVVRPSVTRLNYDKTNESSADILIPYERSIHLVFRHKEWLVGTSLLPEILGQTDPTRSKTADFQSILARSASALKPSEKSSMQYEIYNNAH